ncbi:putative ENOYL-COA HYDRATASE / isolerase [Paraburkholderia piptadeniae]|uniref:ENOYL-COA HYDRATASE / isolerase n=2 Tax=Paraburkholderia piptadeniae TaxID=1701573 RepID=A0A1N7RXT6_9BURK|nr:putative ENOYL-COA HYDRATASE / isolerase [Paraburkholderia piptadeniae]
MAQRRLRRVREVCSDADASLLRMLAMSHESESQSVEPAFYAHYRSLRVRRHAHGILEIVMSGEGANKSNLATADANMHRELADIWRDVDRDPETRVAVIRGEGKGFSAGGDLSLVEDMANDFDVRTRVWREARDLVYNVINCSKPIVSAMHGPAVGAGLVAGLLADISIATKSARIIDGHTRLGVAAGDHAAIVWPLLCGMAKAKYYLMLCEPVSGEEAERIGLVSLAVDDNDLLPKTFEVARKLAHGSQTAIRWTKYALNNWLRSAGPAFDTSLALEFMGFAGPDVQEGVASLRERRTPDFSGKEPF